ncbi:MAG: PadR family transcriptional regulator [Chloroflexota bacterium]
METTHQDPKTFLPLTPAVFHILLALSDQNRHGYGIMKEVELRTEGRMLLKPGTLYQAIKRLLDAGLIEKADEKTDAEINDERRRYYSLSGAGKAVMSAEAERLELLVQLARSKHVLGESKAGFALGR